jgi:7-cyano-7-deazaguanine reductase
MTTDKLPESGSQTSQEMKYGERDIAEGKLITFPNPRVGRRYDISITLPEFTCKCPFSGYPDFATIYVSYAPDERVVELKALKLYINSYRDRYISHEESANQILDDFVAACEPLEVTVKADFTPRGNVHTVVEVRHQKEGKF